MPAWEPPPRPELRVTQVGGFRIHSEHSGAGAAVVLLHGLSGSRRWWRFTVPALARRYAVHVPELVGFGGSRGAPPPTIGSMADIVAGWIDRLGVGDYRLIGHSMGGQIAVHIGARHRSPERLVLVCATGLPRRWTLPAAAQLLAGTLPPRSWGAPAFLPTVAADAFRAGPRSLLLATRHLFADDITPLLPGLKLPTLLVWGELDPLVPLAHGERMADAIAGARLVVLRRAAHNPMADRPAEFNRTLLDFLDAPA